MVVIVQNGAEEEVVADVNLDVEGVERNVEGNDDRDREGDEEEGDEDDETGLDEEEGLNEAEIESIMEARRRERFDLDNGTPYFRVGMTFKSIEEAKFAIDDYSVTRRYDIRVQKSDKHRISVFCFDCTFKLYISEDCGGPTCAVKSITHEHGCVLITDNKRATVKWLAVKFMDRVLNRPSYNSGDMKTDAKSIYKVDVSKAKCIRARRMILEKLDSCYKQEYATLEAYANECMKTNPGSFIKIDLDRVALRDGKRQFSRIFVCFDALKKGWKTGCRPIIGLNGCFLKDICKGVLLVACGRDANDHFYPIAWAVVEKETGSSWEWFIAHLKMQLEIQNGENLTLIFDMQKGLLTVVDKLLPQAEHRWCARHIHADWSKKWRGGELTKWFWICSWSTYPEEFKDNLKKLGSISKEAAEHLISYPPHKWCRAYFSAMSKDMIVTSNHVESFNAWIKLPREKSIYRLLDEVRLDVMNKLKDRDKEASKWKKEWSPKCMKIYNINTEIASFCRVEWNGADGYEVIEGNDRHCVMLDRKLCTCREWELSGIPCPHAICALRHKRVDPMKEISMYYHISSFKKTYSFKLQPVRGKIFWNVEQFEPILPPPIVKMPGRPKKKRIREATEEDRQSQRQSQSQSQSQSDSQSQIQKKSKKGVHMSKKGEKKKCSMCGVYGHNKATCKGPSVGIGTNGPGESSNTNIVNNGSTTIATNANATTELPRHPSVLRSDQQFQDLTNHFYETIRDEDNSSRRNDSMNEAQVAVGDEPILTHLDAEAAMTYLVEEIDPEVTFPIPSEEETRILRRTIAKESTGSRKILFMGDGSETLIPTDLPFERRIRNNKKVVTANALLQAEKKKMIGKKKAKK